MKLIECHSNMSRLEYGSMRLVKGRRYLFDYKIISIISTISLALLILYFIII